MHTSWVWVSAIRLFSLLVTDFCLIVSLLHCPLTTCIPRIWLRKGGWVKHWVDSSCEGNFSSKFNLSFRVSNVLQISFTFFLLPRRSCSLFAHWIMIARQDLRCNPKFHGEWPIWLYHCQCRVASLNLQCSNLTLISYNYKQNSVSTDAIQRGYGLTGGPGRRYALMRTHQPWQGRLRRLISRGQAVRRTTPEMLMWCYSFHITTSTCQIWHNDCRPSLHFCQSPLFR